MHLNPPYYPTSVCTLISLSLLSLCPMLSLCLSQFKSLSIHVYTTTYLHILQSIFPFSYLICKHVRHRKPRNSYFYFTNCENETGKLNHVLGHPDKKMAIGMSVEASQGASY